MARVRRHQRLLSTLAFALLALVAELAGRSVTHRVDRALHVRPPISQHEDYYPFLLGAVKIAVALLLAPWLHTYALPVFAVLAVMAAVVWGAVSRWLADYESYAEATFAHASRLTARAATPAPRYAVVTSAAPRARFGLAFECRPPPLLA